MALRAGAVVGGFSLLASPSRPAPDAPLLQGPFFSKSLGAILLLGAFVPFGEARKRSKDREVGTEEL